MSEYASLCLLSYERPEFLTKTLKSLKENTDFPYELIIHDDGSSDTMTRNLVFSAAEIGNASTVIMNPPGHNQGQGTALNRMFSIASGDPIIKLDADLLFEPNWLSETVETIENNPEIGLLGLLHYWHDPVHSKKTLSVINEEYSVHTHILGSAFAVRRACWEELGQFSEHSDAFAEDWEFQIKTTESDNWVCALPRDDGEPKDLVTNYGMGIGNSVVVTKQGVAKIWKTPHIITSNQE